MAKFTADDVRAYVQRLVDSHGHAAVAAACMRSLSGYAREGALSAAINANELLRDEPIPAMDEMAVGGPLRSALGSLLRATGHQTYFAIVTVLALQYATRGAQAQEVDDLSEPEGNQTAPLPHCPGCRARLAAGVRWRKALQRSRDSRPQGGADPRPQDAATITTTES